MLPLPETPGKRRHQLNGHYLAVHKDAPISKHLTVSFILKENCGSIYRDLNDSLNPESIQSRFEISKMTFKLSGADGICKAKLSQVRID